MNEAVAFDIDSERRLQRSPKATIRVRLVILIAAVDLMAVFAAVGFAATLRHESFLDDQTSNLLIVLLPIYLLLAFNGGAYNQSVLTRWGSGARHALSAILATALVVLGLGFAFKVSTVYSRVAVITGFALSAFALVLGRYFVDRVIQALIPNGLYDEVVLVDEVDYAAQGQQRLIDAVQCNLKPELKSPHMLDRIGKAVWGADRVVVLCPPGRRRAWTQVLKGIGIKGEVLLPEAEQLGLLNTARFNGRITAVVAQGQLNARDELVKRVSDIVMVLAFLPALLVVTLAVALAIKLEDGGPVLFRQVRIGRSNRLFTMYKFRSMAVDACDADGTLSARRGDARVTRVGRWLRATSIDELPQCFNVLRGEMSVVGPRPHAISSTAEDLLFWDIDDRYWLRHAAKPGLTGLAQVRGYRGATSTKGDVTNRIQADLEYLAGWSLQRDLRIILATLRVVMHPNAF